MWTYPNYLGRQHEERGEVIMSEESDKKKKKISSEELAKIMEAVFKAYEQAGKKIAFATLYDKENPEGQVMVPEKKEEVAGFELEFEDKEDTKNDKPVH